MKHPRGRRADLSVPNKLKNKDLWWIVDCSFVLSFAFELVKQQTHTDVNVLTGLHINIEVRFHGKILYKILFLKVVISKGKDVLVNYNNKYTPSLHSTIQNDFDENYM